VRETRHSLGERPQPALPTGPETQPVFRREFQKIEARRPIGLQRRQQRAPQAETAGAKYALVYGGGEIAKGVTKVRSLTDRSEAEVPRTDLVPALRAVLEEGMRAILP